MQRISTLILNFRHSMYNFENTVGRVTRTGLIRRVSVALSVVTTNDNYKVADTSKLSYPTANVILTAEFLFIFQIDGFSVKEGWEVLEPRGQHRDCQARH